MSDTRLLALLKEARAELSRERGRWLEPVAVVGIGCRFPGNAASAEALWRILVGGVDATGEVPADRWNAEAIHDADPEAPGKSYVRRGGFLGPVDGFDAAFFGISPREAAEMDPQQRLLLEVVWEALENAGIPADRLAGSSTGVWIGSGWQDYERLGLMSGDLTRANAYSGTGIFRCVAAGRISYFLGLNGPSIQLDTACSSSLVSAHLAVQSLRSGECDMALAGGVNLLLSAASTVSFCRLGALSSDGRCKTFDASADGYGRAEGCGILVLKRLSDALASGDRIHSLIRGTAVNQDGRSNGMTAPNGLAQRELVRQALANAGVDAAEVGYIEAHGTGTPLGDPIEVMALGEAFGADRTSESPIYLGSVKANLGHTESAAGVAGLIKASLCLSKGKIPPQPHFQKPNPTIPWSKLPFRVPTELLDWPRGEVPRVAGVSSFGISGTNAHAVLEEPPEPVEPAPAPARSSELIVLSARAPEALAEAATRLADHLEAHPEAGLGDLAFSLLTTRSSMDHRLALAAPTRDGLLEALRSTQVSSDGEKVASGAVRVAFVFPGQGSQWLGMGQQLLREEPVFREALEACDRAVRSETGWSVIEELHKSQAESRLERMDVVQPVLFSMQVALAALWRSWGVEPSAVVGHSMGEAAASVVAGALSVEDGAAVICRRTALVQKISGRGQMALVELSMEEAQAAVAGHEDRLAVAACNGRKQTVLSGEPEAMAAVLANLEARGVFCRLVRVDFASHSPQVDPLLPELLKQLQGLKPRASTVSMRSTVSGEDVSGTELNADYWAKNLRQPVWFAKAVEGLLQSGITHFVEISPHPLLVSAVEELQRAGSRQVSVAGSLKRDQAERQALLDSLGALHMKGLPLDASRLFPAGGRRVALPSYAWQRQRYWLDEPSSSARRPEGVATGHPLLGNRVPLAGADAGFENVLSGRSYAWLSDHLVGGAMVVPGAAIAELVRAATETYLEGGAPVVKSLVLQSPFVLSENENRRTQLVLTEQGRHASLYSRPEASADAPWTLHATAEVGKAESPGSSLGSSGIAELRARCTQLVEIEGAYRSFADVGIEYGPVFRGMRGLWIGPGEALAELALADGTSTAGYCIHPALLDAAFQAVFFLLAPDQGGKTRPAMLPLEIGQLVVRKPGVSSALVRARLVGVPTAEGAVADVTVLDASGQVIAEVERLVLRRADPSAIARSCETTAGRGPERATYRVEWQAQESPAPETGKLTPQGRWLVVPVGASDGSARERAEELSKALAELGAANCRVLPAGGTLPAGLSDADHVVCLWPAGGGADVATRLAIEALGVAQAVGGHEGGRTLWWVTRGAVAAVAGEDVDPPSATLWGLGRGVIQELSGEQQCRLLDVDGSEVGGGWAQRVALCLAGEQALGSDENQVAWRGNLRHLARLVPAPAVPAEILDAENYRLEARQPGMLDSLKLVPAPREKPSAGEIEIEVRAHSLNFRDVVVAMDLLSEKNKPIGSECSGVVTAVGEGVTSMRPGDLVMAMAAGSFRRFVTVDARLAARLPRGVSLEQAATIPAVFLTVWYALHDLMKLKRGERLLVHAAAGGVGIAAIQVARWIGAEVYATAHPSKWEFVKSLGVKAVASSRDLEFKERFGEGVDAVLNSLKGPFVDASLSLLSKGGRFVEIGKTDIRDAGEVARAHPGVSYRAFDLETGDPDRIASMLREIIEGFESGKLSLLPMRTYPLAEAEAAFRFMAQGRHVGKLMLLAPRARVPRPDGTALVTGGLGALGLETSRSLVAHGVKRLLLTGRRGMDTPGAAEAVAELEKLGATVTVAAVDVADRERLTQVLAAVPREAPLRIVVHSAGLIDDGLLAEQTPERFARVMSPKVQGAWNLHQLTEGMDLDAFVLFSSAAGTLGTTAQSGYAAANAYLDGLASHRQACGLAGQSLAWGPWAEVGLAAALEAGLRARLARLGIVAVSPAEGRALFEAAQKRSEAQLVLLPFDARAAAKEYGGSVPPLLREIVKVAPATRQELKVDWIRQLGELTPAKRQAEVTDVVRAEVARVLSLGNAGRVPPGQALKELGLDSLMALELRNGLGRRVGAKLSATLAFDYPTASAIGRYLLDDVLKLERNDVAVEAKVESRVVSTEESLAIVANLDAEIEKLEKKMGAPGE